MGVKKVLHDGIPLNREASYASSRSNSRSNSSGRRTSSRRDLIFSDDFHGSYIPFRSESKSSPPSPCETMNNRPCRVREVHGERESVEAFLRDILQEPFAASAAKSYRDSHPFALRWQITDTNTPRTTNNRRMGNVMGLAVEIGRIGRWAGKNRIDCLNRSGKSRTDCRIVRFESRVVHAEASPTPDTPDLHGQTQQPEVCRGTRTAAIQSCRRMFFTTKHTKTGFVGHKRRL